MEEEFPGERGEAYEAPWPGLRAGEPACATREVWLERRGRLAAPVGVPNPAREAGRWEEVLAVERREADEAVGILYLAVFLGWNGAFDGVDVGGTTTQFLAISSLFAIGA